MMHSPSVDGHGMFGESPMMMGSPTSPTSPIAGHQSQFLPGYLLGDTTPHIGSPGPRMWSATSPSPPKSGTRGVPPVGMTTPGTRGEVLRPKEKVGAPPTKSLMGSITSPTGVSSSPFGTPGHQLQSKMVHTPGSLSMVHTQGSLSMVHTQGSLSGTPAPPTMGLSESLAQEQLSQSVLGASQIPLSPAQLDPFYTQGESLMSDDVLDDTWVTVFGFPPAAASFILQQFSQYGNVLKHVVASEGNWMHIHYQSKLPAKKALSKNGKIFGGSIMVGVTPCIEKSVMEEEKENSSLVHPTLGAGTPGNASLQNLDLSKKHTPIRPLTSAYRTARNEYEVARNNQAPQKSNSFMSKTMEYMFGW